MKKIDNQILAAAVEASEESIIITDDILEKPGPTIIYVNPAFTKMTGYLPKEVIGKNPRFLQGPKTDRKVLDSIRETLFKGEVFYGMAINYRKDGTEFYNEWHIEPLQDKPYYLAMQRDVSRRVEMEETLIKQNEALEQKNIALREILSQIENEKNEIKKDVVSNVEDVIMPALKKLQRKGTRLDKQYLSMLEDSLLNLTSSFGSQVSGKQLKLSPREIEIANFIKNGLSNKEIASALNISIKTIETHRNKIRKKLGLINQNLNLTTYLQNL